MNARSRSRSRQTKARTRLKTLVRSQDQDRNHDSWLVFMIFCTYNFFKIHINDNSFFLCSPFHQSLPWLSLLIALYKYKVRQSAVTHACAVRSREQSAVTEDPFDRSRCCRNGEYFFKKGIDRLKLFFASWSGPIDRRPESVQGQLQCRHSWEWRCVAEE